MDRGSRIRCLVIGAHRAGVSVDVVSEPNVMHVILQSSPGLAGKGVTSSIWKLPKTVVFLP